MNLSVDKLKVDPIPVLISCCNPAIEYFTRQDILNEKMGPVDELWEIPSVLRILKKTGKRRFLEISW